MEDTLDALKSELATAKDLVHLAEALGRALRKLQQDLGGAVLILPGEKDVRGKAVLTVLEIVPYAQVCPFRFRLLQLPGVNKHPAALAPSPLVADDPRQLAPRLTGPRPEEPRDQGLVHGGGGPGYL